VPEILLSARIEDLLSLSKIPTYQNGMDFKKSIPDDSLPQPLSNGLPASILGSTVDFEVLYEQLFQNLWKIQVYYGSCLVMKNLVNQ